MINFDAVEFSECRSEEVMFLLTLSVESLYATRWWIHLCQTRKVFQVFRSFSLIFLYKRSKKMIMKALYSTLLGVTDWPTKFMLGGEWGSQI